MHIQSIPSWMKPVLAVAGIYNIIWGAIVVLAPNLFFDLARVARPNYPELWQCAGMIVGLYGLGYWIASHDPMRHWLVVLVGFLGKVLGPIGMAKAIYEGRLPLVFAWVNVTNDVIWWIPFGMILYRTFERSREAHRSMSPEIQSWSMRARSQHGLSILEHSRLRPVLLVFLRHVGCTFCRQALADLSAKRREIEASGTQIVLVHMGHEHAAEQILARYKMDDVPRVWDPGLSVYRAFGLEKGDLRQLMGPRVWLRGFQAGFHGVGIPDGDVSQMPGVFLVFHGELIKSYRHQSVADRPDYVAMVN